MKQRGDWAIDLEYRGHFEALHLPPGWQGDGIIARVTDAKIAEELAEDHFGSREERDALIRSP